MTDFTVAAAIEAVGERRWRAEFPPDWSQGRTTFGGLQAAIGAQAAAAVAGPERPLRTLDVAFVAPVASGPVEVEAEVLGEGRSAVQIQVSLYSLAGPERVLGCRMFVVAGASRVSGVRVEPHPADLQPGDPAVQGLGLPHVPGISPLFTQHVEFRWCSPALPFSGAGAEEGSFIEGWVRHRTAAEGLPALISLLDAWPPAVLPMFAVPAPASSVRWAIHLADARPTEWTGKDWVWHEVRTVQAGDGYATVHAGTYDAEGHLLAWAEQLIALYDKPRT